MYTNLADLKETDWFKERPEVIRQAIEATPPAGPYRFKASGKHCFIIGYEEPLDASEKVTLIVQKTGEGGPMAEMGLGHLDTNRVFGVDPQDLEPVGENYENMNSEPEA